MFTPKKKRPQSSASPAFLTLVVRLGVIVTVMLLTALTGCGFSGSGTTAVPISLTGSVRGGLQPVSGATVQMYAAGASGNGSASQPLLSTPVETDASGNFSIPASYRCPSASSQIFVVAHGGNPGLQSGSANPAIALTAMLGACSSLSSSVPILINEVTTIGSVWPVAPYMKSDIDLGSALNDASFLSAVASVKQFVDLQHGTSPGQSTAESYFTENSKLYSLADILDKCVNSQGGTAGDGSACGTLFSLAATSGTKPPADTLTAALLIAQAPEQNVLPLYAQVASPGSFQPVLAAAPADWTLQLSHPVAAPLISLASGTYTGSQQVSISDATTSANVHYTTDGTTPTVSSPLYTSTILIGTSSTIQAIAILGISQSPVASATLTIATAASTPPPTQLAFLQQPTNTTIGSPLSPAVRVVIQDAAGNTVSSATNLIRVNLTGVYGLGGTLEIAARKGVSTFNNLNVNAAGSYTLTASSPGLTTVTSVGFTIAAAPPVPNPLHLVFIQQPSSAPALSPLAPAVTVAVEDAGNNVVTSASNTVTLALTGNSGTLSGTLSATPQNGVATFNNLMVSTIGNYSLAATSVNAVAATSAAFTITAAAGQTYYVENVNGRDSNTGTTPNAAFATIAKVNSLNLLPGQTVAFASGDEWHEMLIVNHSGALNAPITYTSYGVGAQPIISAADLTSTPWTLVSANVWSHAQTNNPFMPNYNGQLMTAVSSLAAVNTPNAFYWDGSSTIYAYSVGDPSRSIELAMRASAAISGTASLNGANYIVLNNLELRGAQTFDLECQGGAPNTIACGYWSITGNTFNASYANELFWLFAENVTAPGLLVSYNTFKNGGSFGVALANGGVMNAAILHNQFFNLGRIYNPTLTSNAQGDAVYGFSADVGEYQSNVEVGYNDCHDIGINLNTRYGGCYHPDTVTNWNIHNNTAQNTVMPGINIEKGTGTSVKFNLLINAGQYIYTAGLSIRAGEGINVSNMDVENNTTSGGFWACASGVSQDAQTVTATNIQFNKNICVGAASGTELYAGDGANGSGDTFLDNNFGAASTNFLTFAGAQTSTYAGFDALVGYTTGNPQGDPQFVSPGTGNFMLQSTSPAIGIGAFP